MDASCDRFLWIKDIYHLFLEEIKPFHQGDMTDFVLAARKERPVESPITP
jgi:hypothetical protein